MIGDRSDHNRVDIDTAFHNHLNNIFLQKSNYTNISLISVYFVTKCRKNFKIHETQIHSLSFGVFQKKKKNTALAKSLLIKSALVLTDQNANTAVEADISF